MNHVQTEMKSNCGNRPSPCLRWLKSPVAQLLVLTLFLSAMPVAARADWKNLSGTLPGTMSGAEKAGLIAGGAAAAGLVVYLIVRHKRANQARLDNAPFDIHGSQMARPYQSAAPILKDANGSQALSPGTPLWDGAGSGAGK